MGIALQTGQILWDKFCEILSHSVRYGMYGTFLEKGEKWLCLVEEWEETVLPILWKKTTTSMLYTCCQAVTYLP